MALPNDNGSIDNNELAEAVAAAEGEGMVNPEETPEANEGSPVEFVQDEPSDADGSTDDAAETTTPSETPPVDSDHVAEGAQKFAEEDDAGESISSSKRARED